MSTRPNSQETLILALELLRRIPRRRLITAKELEIQLREAGIKRNIRTIQRQLEVLSEHFDIIRDDRSKPYGYKWKECAKGISVPMLSEQESLLLALSEQYLRNLLPSSVMKSMDGFFQQAQQNLGHTTKAKSSRAWLSKVRVVSATQPLLAPHIKPGILDELSNALYSNCWLNVDYCNSSGKRGNFDVMPLGLAQQETRLYLVCRFEGFDNERNMALHRIEAAKAGTRKFERPKEFSLKTYDADGRFGFGEGNMIKLSFTIEKESGAHILESPLSEDQEYKDLGSKYQITASVVETDQLDWWLRGFGDRVSKITRKRL